MPYKARFSHQKDKPFPKSGSETNFAHAPESSFFRSPAGVFSSSRSLPSERTCLSFETQPLNSIAQSVSRLVIVAPARSEATTAASAIPASVAPPLPAFPLWMSMHY